MNSIENRCDTSLFIREDTSLREVRRTLQTLAPYVVARRKTIAARLAALGEDAFHCPSCGQRAVDLEGGHNICLFCLDVFHDSEVLDAHQKHVLGIVHGTRNVDHGFCPDCGSGSAGRRWSDNERIFNLVPACHDCNQNKRDLHWRDFARSTATNFENVERRLLAVEKENEAECYPWTKIKERFPQLADEYDQALLALRLQVKKLDELAARIREETRADLVANSK